MTDVFWCYLAFIVVFSSLAAGLSVRVGYLFTFGILGIEGHPRLEDKIYWFSMTHGVVFFWTLGASHKLDMVRSFKNV